jgi:tetratricopeptide (TPR) repeat protein
MKLSLCMIVKNEQDNLRRCLSSVVSHVDELIVVDTGSTDDTVAIAQEFGAKVSYFEWCDDFAAARNASIERATGDWILSLDADEVLVVENPQFRQILAETLNVADPAPLVLAFYIKRQEVSVSGENTPLYTLRLFRNLPEIRFTEKFHERLLYQSNEFSDGQLAYLDCVRLDHHGYTDELVMVKNLQRNIPILEGLRQRGEISLMLLACLAGFYQSTGASEQAMECLAEAYNRLLPHLLSHVPPDDFRMIPLLMYTIGSEALEQEDYDTVSLLCQRGLEWCPNFPPLNYLTGDLMRKLGFLQGAIAYYEYCLQMGQEGTYYLEDSFDASYMKTFPAYTMGCVYQDLGTLEKARSAFELALSYDPDFELAQAAIAALDPKQN